MNRTIPSIRRFALLGAGLACVAGPHAMGDVLYRGLQNVAIPFGENMVGLNGVYLDIDTGATGTAEFSGWDINPFFGGELVASSQRFQPARVAADDANPILALGTGVTVGSGLFPASGLGNYSGSENHLGAGSGQFLPGQQSYLGFRFTPNGGGAANYGWMRVTFTQNAAGGVIHDWAYETSGSAIQSGGVLRSAPVSGVSTVTLASAAGPASTLGSPVADLAGSVTTQLLKTGPGTTHLAGEHTFTGSTTIASDGGTLGVSGRLSATSAIAVNSGGTLLLSGAGGDDAKLATAATVTLAGGKIDLGGLTSSLDQTIGALTLSADSTLDFGLLAAGHRWAFISGAASAAGLSLHIWNYTPGADHLFFGTAAAPLNFQISFYSDTGATLLGSVGFSGSTGEVTPVPEPSAVSLALALLGLACWREGRGRRRRDRVQSIR